MAGHSWRKGGKDLKDYKHVCLSLAKWHKACGHSVQALWHIVFNDQTQHDLHVKHVASSEMLVPGWEPADSQGGPRVHSAMKAGAALAFILHFI